MTFCHRPLGFTSTAAVVLSDVNLSGRRAIVRRHLRHRVETARALN
jgi:hypothetical protein